jgi:Stage III sporulation protein D.
VDKIFQNHIDIRHIRGGQSTKSKYEKLKEG